MYNQLIERNAIESLLNICQDDQPQYDDDYESEIKNILKRTITPQLNKQKTEISTKFNTICLHTTYKISTQFRLKTETISQTRTRKPQSRVKKIQPVSLKSQGKPPSKSQRDFTQKNQVLQKASIISLSNSTGFSILNQSEYRHPVLVIQKKSHYIPRIMMRLQKQQQFLNLK